MKLPFSALTMGAFKALVAGIAGRFKEIGSHQEQDCLCGDETCSKVHDKALPLPKEHPNIPIVVARQLLLENYHRLFWGVFLSPSR